MIDTTTQSAHEALVLSGYEAFSRGDMESLARLFLPEATWTHRNAGRFAGPKQGFAAIAGFFGGSAELTQGTLRVEPTATLSRGDTVAVFTHMSGRRPDGRVLDDDQVHVFRLEGDRTASVDQYVGDPAAVEAFWR